MTICSGSYSTRPISTCSAAMRAIVATTTTIGNMRATATWIEDSGCPGLTSSCGRTVEELALPSDCWVHQFLSKRAFRSGRRHRCVAESYAPNSEQNSQYDQLKPHF